MGLVEEELIEGEEFDGTSHARRHKPEVHDLDDYEEETLPAHFAPANWAKCCRRLTSTTASN